MGSDIMQQPHEAEEEYFAKLEIEKKRKISQQKHAEIESKEKEALKEAHQMRCANCGLELESIVFKGFAINKCFHCDGVFLDKETFEKLCGRDDHFLSQIAEIFQFKR